MVGGKGIITMNMERIAGADQKVIEQFGHCPINQVALLCHIVGIVAQRQRQQDAGRGVLPLTVGMWLNVDVCEQTLRKKMAALWRAGVLERIGGEGARRGYRVH
jgi:hypothetical protein